MTKAPCSALQHVNLWRSIPTAVLYLETSDMSFDLLVPLSPRRHISYKQDPPWKPGAVSKARFLWALNPRHNQIISMTQPRLSCPQPEIQITALHSNSVWMSGKPYTKSPCLRQGWFICNTHKGLRAGGAFVRTCCCLWDSLQCHSPPDGLTKCLLALRTRAAETALTGPG